MKVDIDGYFFFKDSREDLYLMIADEEYDIVFDYIKEKHIKNIMLSFTGGCSGEDLEFLKEITDFEKIDILFDKPVDLSNLYYQTKLKTLKLGSVPFKLDFSRFKELEHLNIHGQKQELKPFSEKNKIQTLKLNQFLNEDLSFLTHCENLTELDIYNNKKISSLTGLEKAQQNLKRVELYGLPKLNSLWAFDDDTPLKYLKIENCASLNNLSVVEHARKLEVLGILKCKEIDSIAFVNKLPNINNVYLERTKILDGNKPDMVRIF